MQIKLIFTRKFIHLYESFCNSEVALSDYPEEHQEWTGVNRGNDNDNKNIAILKFFRNLPHIAGFLSTFKFFYLSSPIFYFHSFPQ